jgi:soluble lytic murein transglycosylase-like protein
VATSAPEEPVGVPGAETKPGPQIDAEGLGAAILQDARAAGEVVDDILGRQGELGDCEVYDRALEIARRARNQGVEPLAILPLSALMDTANVSGDRVARLVEVLSRDGATAAGLQAQIHRLRADIAPGLAYEIAWAVARQARNRELRPALVIALISVESDFTPSCHSATDDSGLMQLHGRPIYGVRENIADGCLELRGWLKQAGWNEREGLAHYNGGNRPPGVSYRYADKVLGRCD